MTTPLLRPPRRIILINGVYGAPEHFGSLRACLAADAVTDVFEFRRDGVPDPRAHSGFTPMVDRLSETVGGPSGLPRGERPVLLGFSLGGALALEYALTYRDRLSAMVLINAFARFEGSFLQIGTIPALHLWPNQWSNPRLMARAVHRLPWMRRGLFHEDASVDEIESGMRAATGSMSQDDVRFQLAHLLLPEPEDLAPRLATLAEEMPILLVSSRDDMVVPPRHTDRLAVLMPGAERLPPFEGGHAFFQHDARLLAASLTEFLDRVCGG